MHYKRVSTEREQSPEGRDKDIVQVLSMKGGNGNDSYAQNSLQQVSASLGY